MGIVSEIDIVILEIFNLFGICLPAIFLAGCLGIGFYECFSTDNNFQNGMALGGMT